MVQLDEGSSQEMVEGVLTHRNELTMVGRVQYSNKLKVVPFTKDEILLLVSPHCKLIEKGNVFLKELLKEPNNLEGKGIGHQIGRLQGV